MISNSRQSALHPIRHRSLRVAMFTGAVALTASLASCSTTKVLDQDELYKLIETEFPGETGIEVTDPNCPTIEDPTDGQSYECTVSIDGQQAKISVTVTDAEEGTVEVLPVDAILDVAKMQDNVAAQIGDGASVTCSDEAFLVVPVGESITCDALDADGVAGQIEVTAEDSDGNVSFEVVG